MKMSIFCGRPSTLPDSDNRKSRSMISLTCWEKICGGKQWLFLCPFWRERNRFVGVAAVADDCVLVFFCFVFCLSFIILVFVFQMMREMAIGKNAFRHSYYKKRFKVMNCNAVDVFYFVCFVLFCFFKVRISNYESNGKRKKCFSTQQLCFIYKSLHLRFLRTLCFG